MSRAIMLLAITALVLAAQACGTAQLVSGGETDERFRAPSMVELIARAPEFEGWLIETTGFYGGDLTALYLTRDHAEINELTSAFPVADPTEGKMREQCAGHYVRVVGRFERLPGPFHEGPDAKNFGIKDVTSLSILGGNGMESVCWGRR